MADNNNQIYATAMQMASQAAASFASAADSSKARKWQAGEAQKNRDYQTAERLATQEWNLDMWNRTNEWNLEQWHRQNEYDSPMAQLARAREAGINPNTAIASMYGGGSANLSASPITSSPMPGSMASYSDNLASSIMSSISQLGVNTANMLNTLTDRKAKEYYLSYDQMTEKERKAILEGNAKNILKDIEVKDVNIETAKVVLGNLAEMKQQELLNLRELCKRIISERASIDASVERDDRLADANIANTEANTRSTNASIKRDDRVADAHIDNLNANTGSTIASIGRDNRTANASIALVEQQTEQSKEQTEYQDLVNDFANAVGAPPGTPEYLFVKKLADEGKLEEFIDEAYKPLERAKWKPRDYDVDRETSFKVFGKEFGWKNRGNESHNSNLMDFLGFGELFDAMKTLINP